jgi:hypothetical protein
MTYTGWRVFATEKVGYPRRDFSMMRGCCGANRVIGVKLRKKAKKRIR